MSAFTPNVMVELAGERPQLARAPSSVRHREESGKTARALGRPTLVQPPLVLHHLDDHRDGFLHDRVNHFPARLLCEQVPYVACGHLGVLVDDPLQQVGGLTKCVHCFASLLAPLAGQAKHARKADVQ